MFFLTSCGIADTPEEKIATCFILSRMMCCVRGTLIVSLCSDSVTDPPGVLNFFSLPYFVYWIEIVVISSSSVIKTSYCISFIIFISFVSGVLMFLSLNLFRSLTLYSVHSTSPLYFFKETTLFSLTKCIAYGLTQLLSFFEHLFPFFSLYNRTLSFPS